MARLGEESIGGRDLDYPAEISDPDPVRKSNRVLDLKGRLRFAGAWHESIPRTSERSFAKTVENRSK